MAMRGRREEETGGFGAEDGEWRKSGRCRALTLWPKRTVTAEKQKKSAVMLGDGDI